MSSYSIRETHGDGSVTTYPVPRGLLQAERWATELLMEWCHPRRVEILDGEALYVSYHFDDEGRMVTTWPDGEVL